MVAGIVLGLILGAGGGYFVFWNIQRKKDKLASDASAAMNRVARRASSEVSQLRLQVQEYEKDERAGSDLILLFPDLVKMIFTGKDSDEVVSYINRACQSLLKANESAVFIADRTGARLGLSASTGLADVLEKRVNLGLGDGFVGLAAETGRFLFRSKLEKESVLVRRKMIMSDIPGFKPEFAAPMMVEDTLFGVITVGDFEGKGVMRGETLRALAAVGAAALENVRLLERFSRTSSLDPETGFPGKQSLEPVLENELERVERFGSSLAVVELHLKSAESEDGTIVRDVMSVTAKHLLSSLRTIDIGIRAAGSTVIILLPGTDTEGMKSVTGKLGGDIPCLVTDSGFRVGLVGIRSIVVQGGVRLDARDLLDRLRSEESIEFEGHCDA
jgi:GGDEF domain-containing protein